MRYTMRGKEYDVYMIVSRYMADDSLAVTLYLDGSHEPFAVITKCLDDIGLENEGYIDENNCPDAMDFIKRYGLGESTGEYMQSGFCVYPKVRWNIGVLNQYDASSDMS